MAAGGRGGGWFGKGDADAQNRIRRMHCGNYASYTATGAYFEDKRRKAEKRNTRYATGKTDLIDTQLISGSDPGF